MTNTRTHTPGIHAQILTCADMPGRIYNQTHTHTLRNASRYQQKVWSQRRLSFLFFPPKYFATVVVRPAVHFPSPFFFWVEVHLTKCEVHTLVLKRVTVLEHSQPFEQLLNQTN